MDINFLISFWMNIQKLSRNSYITFDGSLLYLFKSNVLWKTLQQINHILNWLLRKRDFKVFCFKIWESIQQIKLFKLTIIEIPVNIYEGFSANLFND